MYDPIYWLIAFGLIALKYTAPIGVLMIVLKLAGRTGRKERRRMQGRHPYYVQQEGQGPAGARTTGGASRERHVPEPPPARPGRQEPGDPAAALDKMGRTWAIAGGATAAGCLLGFIGCLGEPLYWLFQGDLPLFMEEITGAMVLLCCVIGGLGGLWAGLRKRRQARRYRSYLAMIGRQRAVSVSALASATGRSPGQVRDDLADMLDGGLFPQGYLDYGGDQLVLSGEGIPQQQSERTAPPPPSREDEDAILAEIRAVSDAIDNEKLSAQIDRVGIITAKILDYQKSHPERAPQLHSFLSYYLPTTLKILRAYGQLEDQEISGRNITAAMERIEGMMDKVVEGFEKQLDLLFQGDAMDITADVEVLERMLAKDGLSGQGGLTLVL